MRVLRLLAVLFFLLPAALTPAVRAQAPDVLRRAQIHLAEDDPAAAAALLDAAGPLTPDGAYVLGRSYQELLRHDRAAAAFASADTSRLAVLMAWGRSLEALGRTHEAEARYAAAYRLDSTRVPVAVGYARLLGDRGRYDAVAGVYHHLLAADPDNGTLHARLASAYSRLGVPDSAIVHYERAHALDRGNVQVVLALTKVYYDQAFYLSARRVVDRALEAQPRSFELWRRSGEIALRQEDYALAETAFANAVQHGDSTAIDLRNLGVSRYLRGRADAAREALAAAWEREDQDQMTAFYLGLAHKDLGQYAEALDLLATAADLGGQAFVADVYSHRAGTYDVMKRYPEAIREYRLARQLDPDRPAWLFHLAALYDAYYADEDAVLDAYEQFLAAVEAGTLPKLEDYAQRRLQEIREGQFFRDAQRPPAPPTPMDSVVIHPTDTSRAGQHE